MQMNSRWVLLLRLTTIAAVLTVCYYAFTPQAFKMHFSHMDKFYHLVTFAVLFFLLDYSFPNQPINWQKVLPLAMFALGIELVQSWLPYRDFSLSDFGADLAGMLIYFACIPILKRLPLFRLRWEKQVS